MKLTCQIVAIEFPSANVNAKDDDDAIITFALTDSNGTEFIDEIGVRHARWLADRIFTICDQTAYSMMIHDIAQHTIKGDLHPLIDRRFETEE